MEKLSIIDGEEVSLRTNSADIRAALVKGLIGAAPIVGPMISEALSSVIPNQKIDRLITFVQVLDIKVRHLEENFLKQKMLTEEFTDLFEDGLNQAARAMSDERRDYIASLLKNSISREDLAHIEQKKLLSLLGELNDAEVLTLKLHSLRSIPLKSEFAEQHAELFLAETAHLGSPRNIVDRQTLRSSYNQKLIQLGLLQPRFEKAIGGAQQEFDEKTGTLKSNGYTTSSLGRILLQYIDMGDDQS